MDDIIESTGVYVSWKSRYWNKVVISLVPDQPCDRRGWSLCVGLSSKARRFEAENLHIAMMAGGKTWKHREEVLYVYSTLIHFAWDFWY